MNKLPSISIITVVYNRRKEIEITFQNVLVQEYPFIEYIVIDGGSTDGTKEYLLQHVKQISHFVSEPDKGIYDAMNKGLNKANSDYVLFLNAGDVLATNTVLKEIFQDVKTLPDAVYGDTIFCDENLNPLGLMSELSTRNMRTVNTWKDMRLGMVFSHQSFLVKRNLAPLYNTSYKYSADIDWIIRCLKACSNIYHFPKAIACFQLGGFSSVNKRASLIDRYHILRAHFGFFPNVLNHLRIFLRMVFSPGKMK